jgi:hypothetical protein
MTGPTAISKPWQLIAAAAWDDYLALDSTSR